MKYDIKLLQAFLVFAESKNINEAALKLQVSQPAMSAYLKNFEASLPHSLFLMQGRKKTLTAYGHEIYLQLKERLKFLDDVVDQVSAKHGDQRSATIRVGGRSEILVRVLRTLKFPGHLMAIECSSKIGIPMLQNSQLDLLIAQVEPDSLNLIAKPFFKDRFQILLPEKMKIRGSRLNKELFHALAKLPFLAYRKDLEPFTTLRRFYEVNEPQNTLRTIANWPVLVDLCEKGMGWTLCPTSFPFNESKCRSIAIPEDLLPAMQFYFLYPKNFSKTGWFAGLIKEIQEGF